MKEILIIEDDISIAELERDYLEIEGFKIQMAHTGKAGFDLAVNGKFDLIIIDIMLPGMDGFEICRTLRKQTEIPLIIVSARIEDFDKIRGLGLGADDYVTKPFSPTELVARVKAHLSRYDRLRGTEEAGALIEIRGLVIDEKSRRVMVNGNEAVLTTKEFDILAYLARHPDRAFTKEEIFDSIWGDNSFGDISTITVHIRKIREKIELDPANPEYIETIWGVGYRFRV